MWSFSVVCGHECNPVEALLAGILSINGKVWHPWGASAMFFHRVLFRQWIHVSFRGFPHACMVMTHREKLHLTWQTHAPQTHKPARVTTDNFIPRHSALCGLSLQSSEKLHWCMILVNIAGSAPPLTALQSLDPVVFQCSLNVLKQNKADGSSVN